MTSNFYYSRSPFILFISNARVTNVVYSPKNPFGISYNFPVSGPTDLEFNFGLQCENPNFVIPESPLGVIGTLLIMISAFVLRTRKFDNTYRIKLDKNYKV